MAMFLKLLIVDNLGIYISLSSSAFHRQSKPHNKKKKVLEEEQNKKQHNANIAITQQNQTMNIYKI